MGMIAELKRRKVFKVGAAYLVVAWLAVQAMSIGFPAFDAPPWVLRVFILVALLGFPVAVVMAWVLDVTPGGIRLDTRATGSKRLFASIVVLIALAVLWYAYGQPSFRKGDVETPRQAVAAQRMAPGNSLAVMAFEDLSPAHDQGYFSDGMSEEILNALARVKGLKVIGRSSSFQYKGRNVGATEVGRALGVSHLLEGSVRRQGERLRITATLVRTDDGEQEWSQAYDGKLSDVFDLQESCARAIAAQLKVALAGGGTRLVAKASDSPQAYALFVEAQTLVNRRIGDSLPRAIALLDKAIAIDPHFARAWSKQAVAYAVLAQYTGGDWHANWQRSDAAARRAIALDPDDAEALAALSYNAFSQRHYVDMVEPMRRALQIAPDNSAVGYWNSNELSALGRTRDAEAQLDASLRDDPANPLLLFYKGMMRWRSGDAAGALQATRRMGEGDKFAQFILGWVSGSRGDVALGAEQYATGEKAFGSPLSEDQLRTIFRGTFPNSAERPAALAIVMTQPDNDWAPTNLLQLGEPEKSFALFEQGKSGLSDAYLNWLWQAEPFSRKARQDPAFQGFAERMGLVAYWKANGWPDLCRPTPAAGVDAFACQ